MSCHAKPNYPRRFADIPYPCCEEVVEAYKYAIRWDDLSWEHQVEILGELLPTYMDANHFEETLGDFDQCDYDHVSNDLYHFAHAEYQHAQRPSPESEARVNQAAHDIASWLLRVISKQIQLDVTYELDAQNSGLEG